ncbi:MAG TPA: tRNA epoxyqueuosine(34) reductase QueG, partial [Gemmatimonadales bacterium]|nr:tRNA epoxyqueuosine(34) reductase QueG [Gemmatimonadales bacterium]
MTLDASRVKARAQELGFLACGITDTSPPPHAAELDRWLARGHAGTMRYMHRQAAKRKSPELIVPEARSVVVVIDNYYTSDTPDGGAAPRVAKYARGEDYHRVTFRRLDALAVFLRQNGAAVARPYVDAGPVPERELAQRAGLGWIGKNTMLIRPGAGSFFFIGSVFTDLLLPPDPPFALDHCGSCTRCLDACPTNALFEPRALDATRCISYLTIEHRGPIPNELAERFDGWVFGCDICNDVCPWNERFATPTSVREFHPRDALRALRSDALERMTPEEFAARFGDTPLERAGLEGMRRNLRAVRSPAGRPAG